jgi:peptidyl-prolyl cis-trans isomerase D
MAMMGWMRRTSRYFLAVVVITFVGSLAYFGATRDQAPADAVATVNGEPISPLAFQRAYRATLEQYRQIFKDRFNEELVRSLRLQEQVLDRLVVDHLLEQRARAEGLAISDEELSAEITRIGAFHEGGRFSREQYLRVLRGAQLTPLAFEQDLRSDLLRRKLQALITDGVKVADGEVRQEWEVHRTRIRAAYVAVPTEPFLASVAVTDADLEAYTKANAARLARPERRRVQVAAVPAASVPLPAVSDAEVETAYQARLSEFEQPRRVRVAHVLVRVPSVGGSAAEDQAKAKAESALERIRDGADFAQVAREVSEDTGTAARGGEVGLVGKGELVPEFEAAAFELKPGEVTGPVRTPFGYHVIKALEVVPAHKKELREVAPEIRASLATEKQLRLLEEKAREAQQALSTAPDFAAAARGRGLAVRDVGPSARTDALEGIGRVREATDAIFGLVPGGVSEPVKVPEGYAIFRLAETEPAQRPEDVKLADVRDQVSQAVRKEKAQAAAQAKARELAEAWRGGQEGRELATREGFPFAEIGPFSRSEPAADREAGAVIGPLAFTLPAGGVGGPAQGPKGFYVVKVVAREAPDPAAFEKEKAELERELLTRKRTQVWDAWLATLRAQAAIEINRTILAPS